VVNINLHWSDEESEHKMRQFMRRLINRFGEVAESMDMLHPYLFQNHAFEEQDVFAGSGESKLARLRAIRHEVDPDGVFQRLQPGFFKLGLGSEASKEKSEL
jgi:FAD/FMN-containing dehydrogenase